MTTYSNLDGMVIVEGQFTSARVQRIVAAIKDYEPRLEVEWIPPSARREGQAAYRIVYNQDGLPPYILFHVTKDEDFDERVLYKIIANDQRTPNGKAKYSDLVAWEKTQELVGKQEYLDQMEEAKDMVKVFLRSKLNTFDFGNGVVLKEGIPGNAAVQDDMGRDKRLPRR
jgi:hypothetical protein